MPIGHNGEVDRPSDEHEGALITAAGVVAGVAVIPVKGVLIQRLGWLWEWGEYLGVSGYDRIRFQFMHALANEDIDAVVTDPVREGRIRVIDDRRPAVGVATELGRHVVGDRVAGIGMNAEAVPVVMDEQPEQGLAYRMPVQIGRDVAQPERPVRRAIVVVAPRRAPERIGEAMAEPVAQLPQRVVRRFGGPRLARNCLRESHICHRRVSQSSVSLSHPCRGSRFCRVGCYSSRRWAGGQGVSS